MTTPIYSSTDYRKNLTQYWQQYFPNWAISKGYHVHHIKPKCTFKDKEDPFIHHPKNLIALHPDDHISIHKCRGDKFVNGLIMIAKRVVSDETKLKLRNINLGKVRSEESKLKQSISGTGLKKSKYTRLKMSLAQKGKIVSDSARHNMKISRRKRLLSDKINKKTSFNKKKYTNGIINKFFIPGMEDPGFSLGYVNGNLYSKESIEKGRSKRTGRKFFNNGLINKMCKPGTEPEGFISGRKLK